MVAYRRVTGSVLGNPETVMESPHNGPGAASERTLDGQQWDGRNIRNNDRRLRTWGSHSTCKLNK